MKNPFRNFFKGADPASSKDYAETGAEVAKTPPKQKNALISEYYSNRETEKLHDTYTREFSELTTENLRFYFLSARKGINFFKAFLFDEIKRRDLRIGGICETRKLSALSNEWDIEGDNKEHVDFIKENFERINIDQVMSDVVEAQLQGMSVFQLFYEILNNKMYLQDVTLVPNYLIYSKGEVKFIDFQKMNVYSLRSEASSEIPKLPFVEYDPNYFFEVYSFDGNEENGLLNGLIDSIIYGFFFKSYGIKDYSMFVERFAIPAVIGEYDPLMSKLDRDALWNAVKNFGNLFKAMIPNTAKLNTVSDQSKGATSNVFSDYIKYWDDSLSIRVLGEAMTTDTGEGGSFAKAKVGKEVSEDKKAADRILIKAAFNGLIKKLLDINYASVREYPKFEFQQQEDLVYKNSKAEMLVKLKGAGWEADQKEVEETFEGKFTKSLVPSPSPLPFSQRFADPSSLRYAEIKRKEIDKYLDELFNSIKGS